MDVDTERMATDDEQMDYEEDPGSDQDVDGDEMMDAEATAPTGHEHPGELVVEPTVHELQPQAEGGAEEKEEEEEYMEAEPTVSPSLPVPLHDASPFFIATATQHPIPPISTPVISQNGRFAGVHPDVPASAGAGVGEEAVGEDVVVDGDSLAAGRSGPHPLSETMATSTTSAMPVSSSLHAQPHPESTSQARPIPSTSTEHSPQTDQLDVSEEFDQPVASTSQLAPTDPIMPSTSTRVTSMNSDEGPNNEEEYYEEETEEGEDEVDEGNGNVEGYLNDVHSLPPIILHLPKLGARCLFTPLPQHEEQHQQLKLPVWLSGRKEELGEASLADVWMAIRQEMARERVVESGELILVEKHMDLKMGEDDANLQSITFLELMQLHYACDLPTPVQLYMIFEPHRFITRFNAIQQEVHVQAERRQSQVGVSTDVENAMVKDVQRAGKAGYGEEEEGDEDEAGEEKTGSANDGNDDDVASRVAEDAKDEAKRKKREELLKQRRGRAGGVARAEYGGSSKAERPGRVESDHPNADWAHGRPILPMHIPGNRIVVAPTSEDRLVTAMPGTEDVEFDIATLPPPHASREIVELEDRKNEGHDDVSEAGGKASIHVDNDKDTVEQTTQDSEDQDYMAKYVIKVPLDEMALHDWTAAGGDMVIEAVEPEVDEEAFVDEGIDVTDPAVNDGTKTDTVIGRNRFDQVEPSNAGLGPNITEIPTGVPFDEVARAQQKGEIPLLSFPPTTPLETTGVETPLITTPVMTPTLTTARTSIVPESTLMRPTPAAYDDKQLSGVENERTGDEVFDDLGYQSEDSAEENGGVNAEEGDGIDDAVEQVQDAEEQVVAAAELDDAAKEIQIEEDVLDAEKEMQDAQKEFGAQEDVQRAEMELAEALKNEVIADAKAEKEYEQDEDDEKEEYDDGADDEPGGGDESGDDDENDGIEGMTDLMVKESKAEGSDGGSSGSNTANGEVEGDEVYYNDEELEKTPIITAASPTPTSTLDDTPGSTGPFTLADDTTSIQVPSMANSGISDLRSPNKRSFGDDDDQSVIVSKKSKDESV